VGWSSVWFNVLTQDSRRAMGAALGDAGWGLKLQYCGCSALLSATVGDNHERGEMVSKPGNAKSVTMQRCQYPGLTIRNDEQNLIRMKVKFVWLFYCSERQERSGGWLHQPDLACWS
jgi:hypothetical protein